MDLIDNTYQYENLLFFYELLKKLSIIQKRVIVYKYLEGYSDIEISKILKISRQAVNKLKNRGLENIRKNYRQS